MRDKIKLFVGIFLLFFVLYWIAGSVMFYIYLVFDLLESGNEGGIMFFTGLICILLFYLGNIYQEIFKEFFHFLHVHKWEETTYTNKGYKKVHKGFWCDGCKRLITKKDKEWKEASKN